MKLHVFAGSPNAKKTLIANEFFGKKAEVVNVDIQAGAHKTGEFFALNPNAKIPVLEFDDGTSLWESNAIVNRLAAEVDTDMWPKSNARYDIMRWQFWEACHFTPACNPFIAKYLFKNDSVDLAKAQENFRFFARVINGHLESNEWLATENITTADISVASVLCYRNTCQYPMDEFGHLKNWIEKIEKMSEFSKYFS